MLQSLANPKIGIWIIAGSVYVGAAVFFLYRLGLWTSNQTKDTIIWFIFTGMTTAFGLVGSWNGESLFKMFARDALKVTIILEFLTGEYTLPLLGEVLLVPCLFVLGGVSAVADINPEHAKVKPIIAGVVSIVGLVILGVAITGAIGDWQHLRSVGALRSLFLAPMLSLLFAPFAYVLLLYATYESTLVPLSCAFREDKALYSYARRRLVRTFGPRLHDLWRFSKLATRRFWSLQTPADIDRLLATPTSRLEDEVDDDRPAETGV